MGSNIKFVRQCSRPITAEIWGWIYDKLGYKVEITYVVNLPFPFSNSEEKSYIEVRCEK